MKIVKITNNSVVNTYDEEDREIIVMERGVGFEAKGDNTIGGERVEKILRLGSQNAMGKFKELLKNFLMKRVRMSAEIISYAKEVLNRSISPNVHITPAGHIDFALKRYK